MKVLIIEDEQRTALLLKEFIEWHATYSVVGICDSIESAVHYLRLNQQNLDVIFMDIELSDGQSFEIFDKISVTLPVVFCTSYNEFVLKAFKNHGIDYILKPFTQEDIKQTIQKVEGLKGSFAHQTSITANLKEILAPKPNYQTSFLIRFREKIYPIFVTDIAFVYLENETTYLYNFKGEKHPLFKSLDVVESSVSPDDFYRINRQMLINRKAIKDIETYFNQRLVVHLTVPTPEKALVSRQKVTTFLDWVEKG
jgi:two-component system, LytTR family, response regulator LytT